MTDSKKYQYNLLQTMRSIWEDMPKHGLIYTFDGNAAREQGIQGKSGFSVVLVRLFVVVLVIMGIFMLYQMHLTNRLLFNISAQFDKLYPQPLDKETETNLQQIMNLDWICFSVCFLFYIKEERFFT